MPTPVGHGLAGLALHLGARDSAAGGRGWGLGLWLIALANLPDIDFLPGYFTGQPSAFHWSATHSVAAALIAGLAGGAFLRRWTGSFSRGFGLAFVAYGSHIVLDLLLGPGGPPAVGLQVFWPFSMERHMLPWNVFQMMPLPGDDGGPIRALFSRQAVPVIVREVLILGPICLAAWAVGRVRHGITTERDRTALPHASGRN
ncbi:MAG TPA: metal-dependent hydrolase [Longimicrobiales bacterium]|nr:metal-dependent hydrolase [Longimicrobiales bacterium]